MMTAVFSQSLRFAVHVTIAINQEPKKCYCLKVNESALKKLELSHQQMLTLTTLFYF